MHVLLCPAVTLYVRAPRELAGYMYIYILRWWKEAWLLLIMSRVEPEPPVTGKQLNAALN